MTVRKSVDTWFKFQVGRSDGLVSNSLLSSDGGFTFLGTASPGLSDSDAFAYRADVSVGLADFLASATGRISLYAQRREAGYSAPGLTALTDTDQYGGTFRAPLGERLRLSGKADRQVQDDGLETTAAEIDVGYALTDHWELSTGVRHDRREDDSPVVPVTQEEGHRTDAVVQAAYDSKGRWRGYGFAQATLAKTGDRDDNHRGGVGGAYRIDDRLVLDGEVSYGDDGPAAKVGARYQQSDRTSQYLSYEVSDDLAIDGVHARRGNLISGARSRLSDSSSVYLENRYQHGDSVNGLSRAMGITLTPNERWNLSASWENGKLFDRLTYAETKRRAGGARVGYGFENLQLSSAIEYRFDDAERPDGTSSKRTTWLFKNGLKFQMSPDWRLLGKFNHAFSDSSLGQFFDGGFTEAVLGAAYRPVKHDRLDALAKYTYFYNVPTTDQLGPSSIPAEFIQKSHIASLDLSYDLTANWSVGAKYAYRLGEVSLDREDRKFLDNSAHLFILRTDLRLWKHWEGLVEGRMLYLPDLDERRAGALVGIYRYFGEHFKLGVGYNFTDFSEDLRNLSYDHQGVFINLIGTL